MDDPVPENITGQKVQKATHSVEWQINVSRVLLFVGVAYVGAKLLPALAPSDGGEQPSDEDDGRDLVDIDIQRGGLRN